MVRPSTRFELNKHGENTASLAELAGLCPAPPKMAQCAAQAQAEIAGKTKLKLLGILRLIMLEVENSNCKTSMNCVQPLVAVNWREDSTHNALVALD